MRLAGGRGRLKEPATTAPGWRASWPAAARPCWIAAARRGLNGGCAAKTTRWTRFERRGQRWPARRLRFLAPANGARRCGCCWSRVAAPSRCVAKRSRNCAGSSSPPQSRSAGSCADSRREACSSAAVVRCSSRARPDELANKLVLRSLARRIQAAPLEADQLAEEILALVRALAPQLLDEPGVGPIVAAQLIVAWSHRGRLRCEACFARHRRRRHPGLHRPTRRRGQDQPRRHPAAQALPRPPPLPAAATTGAADGSTSHRSIIPEGWPRRGHGFDVERLGCAATETIKRPDNSASQPTSRADHRRLRADPRRGWARR
jgi:hypothetical protein